MNLMDYDNYLFGLLRSLGYVSYLVSSCNILKMYTSPGVGQHFNYDTESLASLLLAPQFCMTAKELLWANRLGFKNVNQTNPR